MVTNYRDVIASDGGLTNFTPVPPSCTDAVRVSCFPSEQLKMSYPVQVSPDTFESWCAGEF